MFPPTTKSLAMPTPPLTTNAPVVVDVLLATLVANNWPVKFKAPLTCKSLSIVVNVPAGSIVKLPLLVCILLPENKSCPTYLSKKFNSYFCFMLSFKRSSILIIVLSKYMFLPVN